MLRTSSARPRFFSLLVAVGCVASLFVGGLAASTSSASAASDTGTVDNGLWQESEPTSSSDALPTEPLPAVVSPDAEALAGARAAFVVTTLADSGPGSLREALELANGMVGEDTITVDPALSGIVELESTLTISSSVQIIGSGQDQFRLVPSQALVDAGGMVLTLGSVDPQAAPNITVQDLSIGDDTNLSLVMNQDNVSGALSISSLTFDHVTFDAAALDVNAYSSDPNMHVGNIAITNTVVNSSSLFFSGVVGDVELGDSTFLGSTYFAVSDIVGDVVVSGVSASADASSFGYFYLTYVSGDVTIRDCVFEGSTGSWQIYMVSGALNISGVTVGAPGDGGAAGFSITNVRTSIDVSNVSVTNRHDPFMITGFSFSDTGPLVPITFDGVTIIGDGLDNGTGAVVINGQAFGATSLSDVEISGYSAAVTVTYTKGAVVISDSSFTGKDSWENGSAISVLEATGGLTLERVAVKGFQSAIQSDSLSTGAYVIRNSVLTDFVSTALMTSGALDLSLENVYIARADGAVAFDPPAGSDQMMTISGSTFEDTATADVSGNPPVVVDGGRLEVSESTFFQGSVPGDVDTAHFIEVGRWDSAVTQPAAVISHSTFSGLGVLRSAGDPALSAQDQIRISHVIGDSIDAIGGIQDGHADVTLVNGGLLDIEYSIFSATQAQLAAGATQLTWGPGNQPQVTSAEKNLGPLQDNGGETPTMRLLSGSVAIDAGAPSISPAIDNDQRGFIRVYRVIDIGAVEMNYGMLVVTPADTADGGQPLEVTISRTQDTDSDYGIASADLILTPGTAEQGLDYIGDESRTVTLAAGELSSTIFIPTVAVPGRDERTLTANLVVNAEKTPISVDAHTSNLIIQQTPAATAPPVTPPPVTPPPSTPPVTPPPVTPAPSTPPLVTDPPAASPTVTATSSPSNLPSLAVTGTNFIWQLIVIATLLLAAASIAVARRRN